MADITEKGKMPIVWAAGLLVGVIGCTTWLSSSLSNLKAQITEVSYELRSVKERLEAATSRRWTSDDQALWEQQLKNLNPSIVLPPRFK